MVVRGGVLGVGTAAGLVFFAFAGYARIATLGEEVRDPKRTLPRAILIALGVTLVTYLLVAVALLVGLGPERLATESAPLVALVDTGRGQRGRGAGPGRRRGRGRVGAAHRADRGQPDGAGHGPPR